MPKFDNYHPKWDAHTFNQDQYTNLLKTLVNKKEDEVLMVEENSVTTASKVMQLWQQIKGFFGFENQTDPTKVNYELLKLLKYGENCRFFEQDEVKGLVTRLKSTLSSSTNQVVVDAIGDILKTPDVDEAVKLVDKKINAYYDAHKDDLHEAFWPNFFHTNIAPLKRDNAKVLFTSGTIQCSEGKYDQGISEIERAIELNPSQSEWKMELAKIKFDYAKQQAKKNEKESDIYSLALFKGVKAISNTSVENPFREIVTNLSKGANLPILALTVKLGDIDDALKLASFTGVQDVVQQYDSHVRKSPEYKADSTHLKDFIFGLAKRDNNPDLIDRGITILHAHLDEGRPVHDEIVKAYFMKSETSRTETDKVYDAIMAAGKIIGQNPGKLKKDTLESFRRLASETAKQVQDQNPRQAIALLYILKGLPSNDAATKSGYALQLADLHEKLADKVHALQEIEEAHTLNPTREIAKKFISALNIQAAAVRMQGGNREAIVHLEKVLRVLQTGGNEDRQMLSETLSDLRDLHTKFADWDKAYDCVTRLITAQPLDWKVHLSASDIASKLNNEAAARKHAEDALRIAPNEPKTIMRVYGLTGRIDHANIGHAIAALESEVAGQPTNWVLRWKLGELHIATNSFTKARSHLQQAAIDNKQTPQRTSEIYATLGKLEMDHDAANYEKALEYYAEAAKLARPGEDFSKPQFDCRMALAETARKSANHTKMFEHYDQAQKLIPAERKAVAKQLLSFGKGMIDQNKPVALQAYEKVLSVLDVGDVTNADLAHVHETIAEKKYTSKIHDEAIKHLKAAVDLQPDSIPLRRKLAHYYNEAGRLDEAKQILSGLSALGGQSAADLVDLAKIHMTKHDYETALEQLERAKKMEGSKVDDDLIFECLLKTAESKKDSDPTTAVARYKKALERRIIRAQHKKEIATHMLDIATNNKEKFGHDCYQAVLALKIDNDLPAAKVAAAYAFLGREDLRNQQFSSAIDKLEGSLKYAPYDSQVVEDLAMAYVQQGFDGKGPHYINDARKHIVAAANSNKAGPVQNRTPKFYAALAELDQDDNKFDSALRNYAEAAKLAKSKEDYAKPQYECHMSLAEIAKNAKDYNKMFDQYDEAKSCLPEERKNIAKTLFNFGKSIISKNKAVALQAYEKALPDLKGQGLSNDDLAAIHQALAQQKIDDNVPGQAIVHLEDARLLLPKNNEIRKKLATCYEKTNQPDKARQLLSEIIASGEKDATAYETLANHHLQRKEFESALECYQKAAAASENPEDYDQKIYECLIKIAESKEFNQPALAFERYRDALILASLDQQRQIAPRLLDIGLRLKTAGMRDKAVECIDKALSFQVSESTYTPQKLMEAYTFLAEEALSRKDYDIAIANLEKASIYDQYNAKLYEKLADVYKTVGNQNRAIIFYRKAVAADPRNEALNAKVMAMELARGNDYYGRGVHNLDHVRTSITSTIAKILSGQHGEAIRNSLSPMGWISRHNPELLEDLEKAGQNAKNPKEIEEEGLRAIELINIAYDGKAGHMEERAKPAEIRKDIEGLKKKLSDMREYYQTLQTQTNDLVTILNETQGAPKISLRMLPKITDLSSHSEIIKQAKDVLTQVDTALNRRSAQPITQELKTQIESLRQMATPKGWLHKAIDHYSRAVDPRAAFGDHHNNLIDAYVYVGEFTQAFEAYNRFKGWYPRENNLKMSPHVYEEIVKAGRTDLLSNEELVKGLIDSGDNHIRSRNYTDASNAYEKALAQALTLRSTQQRAEKTQQIVAKMVDVAPRLDAAEALKTYESSFLPSGNFKVNLGIYRNIGCM